MKEQSELLKKEPPELLNKKRVIVKIINNNIVSSTDIDGEEMIIMGRGIGFGKKTGEVVKEDKIEKIFKLDSPASLEKYKELLSALPWEYIQVSNDIITYAKETLGAKLSPNLYLTLTDHIGFVIDWKKKGKAFKNALQEEVKLFYPSEYAVGKYALHLIETRTQIRLGEDEAASIALHLVNAEVNSSISLTFTMIKMIQEMMGIVEGSLALKGRNSYPRDRLIMNLKQLGSRLLSARPLKGYADRVLYDFVQSHCAEECGLINEVDQYIKEKYDCQMTTEERIYLTLDIKRIKDIYQTEK